MSDDLQRALLTDPRVYALHQIAQRVAEINPEFASTEQMREATEALTLAAVKAIDGIRAQIAAELRGAITAGTVPAMWVGTAGRYVQAENVAEWAAQVAEGQRSALTVGGF